jgi:DNA-binding NtrC family response regulator
MGTPISSRPLHVLVADAESLVRWALTEALTTHGCLVTEVSTAAAALQLLGRPHTELDVILLDHCISDTHDLSLLDSAVALSPRSRVVMLNACMPPEMAAEARRHGAWAVLEKPLDLDAVVALVTGCGGASPGQRA